MKWDRWQTKSRKGAYPLFGFLFSVFQFICKGIFVILELVVYPVHIGVCSIYTVEHRVTVLLKMDGTVAELLKLWMGAVFQGSGNYRQTVPGFQGVLPYAARSLVI